MREHGWKLLDRDLDAQAIDEATRHVAQEKQSERRGTEAVVVFRIGAEWLALPAAAFDEIMDMRPVHTLPHRSNDLVLGLTNVRGTLLVCVSLARVLGIDADAVKEHSGYGVHRRLIVLRGEGTRVVFPADDVYGTHWFEPEQFKPVPATVAQSAINYTKAMVPWRDKVVGLLDDRLLFYTMNRSLE